MTEYWEIEEGTVDSARFFESLWRHFPDSTTFYAEGCAIDRDVRNVYLAHREDGEYVPAAQTVVPRSEKFRCRFTARLAAELSTLAETHAETELLDHLALYNGSQELLFWHDAFGNVLEISRAVPENIVSAFAADLGLRYRDAQAG
jgi:hypothetical protein